MLEETIFGMMAAQASEGDGYVNLLTTPDDADLDPTLISPTTLDGVVSVMLGPTGSTKSVTEVAKSLVSVTGTTIGPYRQVRDPGRVLYMDGEAQRTDIWEIATAIGRGHGLDIEAVHHDELLIYKRFSNPIVDNPEPYRRAITDGGFGLVIVDSVDTARGPDATNMSGPFYDVLRYFDTAVSAVEHVPLDKKDSSMHEWRAIGSVRSTNRPRQTWAIKASEPKEGVVQVHLRLNYANRGVSGTKLGYSVEFEMQNGRFYSIRFSDSTVVEEAAPTNEERLMIAVLTIQKGGGATGVKTLREVTGLTDSQISKAKSGCRGDKKRWISEKNLPLKVESAGTNHLDERWPNGEYPDPKEGNE